MKIYIETLGCPKNEADSRVLSGMFLDKHYILTNDPKKADLVVVNTCGFIRDAAEESIQALIAYGTQLKTDNPTVKVMAMGCLVQRYAAELIEEIPEVDSKLVKMAQEYEAKIVTNDFNLNKVSELQGVFVLNINELANAVKPVVLPGEEMDVKVIKEGKEDRQGIGYLDDGTMIVVDNGIEYMDEDIAVMVTSILQTAAGRMIFAKPKAENNY